MKKKIKKKEIFTHSAKGVFSQATIDAAPVGLIVFDENLKIIDANSTILNLIGCDKQYFTENFLNLSPEFQPNGDKSREKSLEMLKNALNGENLTVEWIHRTLSGELIPFEITLTRIKYMGIYLVLSYQYDLRHFKAITLEIENQRALLKERLEQQELISEISRSFISSGEIKNQINNAIAKLGNYFKVSCIEIINIEEVKNGDFKFI